jgi:hypothetical protein
MMGIQPPEAANYFVLPQGHFLGNADAFPQGAKPGNIPYIPCVSHLGNRSRCRLKRLLLVLYLLHPWSRRI